LSDVNTVGTGQNGN